MASPHHKLQLKQYLNSHKKSGESLHNGGDTINRTRHASPSSRPSLKKPVASHTKEQSPSHIRSTTSSTNSPKQPARHRQHARAAAHSSTVGLVRGMKRLNMKGNKMVFDWLPDELVLKIFAYLDAASLLITATVCRRWLGLANENVLWEPIYKCYCHRQKKTIPENVNWKKECIAQCVKYRNKLIFPATKRKDLNVEKAGFKKLGCQFSLSMTTSDKDDHTMRHSTISICHRSVSVTWHGLELPPIAQIRNIKVFAHAPLFFDQQQNVIKSSPCSRSLLIDYPFEWRKWSSTLPPGGGDDRVQVYFLPEGFMIGTWKKDGELAFISLCLHIHNLRERCLYGSGDRIYTPTPHEPILDDIDSQYGLHDYSCFVGLRNQKKSIWGMQFTKLFCKKENVGNGFATLAAIRPENSVDHTILTSDQQLELPWRTDLFDGVIKGVCILDMTLEDERGTVMWSISSPVKVTHTGESANYDYDGETFSIDVCEERGKVCIQLVWVPEMEKFFMTGLLVHLSVNFINEWFGTNY